MPRRGTRVLLRLRVGLSEACVPALGRRAWRSFGDGRCQVSETGCLARGRSAQSLCVWTGIVPRGRSEALHEAPEHLIFANAKVPTHLATFHVLGQVLISFGHKSEARRVLTEGCGKVGGVGHGMGRRLGPAMAGLLETP